MTLPPLLNTEYGSQRRRFMDPRDVIYHENDMQWDNTYQFQLSSDVDFSIPARSNNPFVHHPPLASSVPKNPSLPAISHDPHAFPDQTTVSPPMLHERTPGFLLPTKLLQMWPIRWPLQEHGPRRLSCHTHYNHLQIRQQIISSPVVRQEILDRSRCKDLCKVLEKVWLIQWKINRKGIIIQGQLVNNSKVINN